MDFSQVKKWKIPVNGTLKEVKSVTANGKIIWKGTWLYTIKLGNYVSKVKYSTDNTNWTSITSDTNLELDSGLTLYIKAETYSDEPRTYQYSYTMTNYNFDITRNEDNDGGEVTVYRTATALENTYSLSGSCTNATVGFYSDAGFVTSINTAKYGATVYYYCTGNEGYEDKSGSLVVNENNFTLNTTNLTASVNIQEVSRLSYTITFAQGGEEYGSWSKTTETTAFYGDKLSINGNTVTCKAWNNNTTRWTSTFTNGSATEYWYYVSYTIGSTTFDSEQTIKSNKTVTAVTSRERKYYTITFNNNTYGTWSSGTLTGYYGDQIVRENNTVKIYKYDATTTLRGSSTFSITNPDAAYDYPNTYTNVTTTKADITGERTITVTTSPSRKSYTITFRDGNWGSWSVGSITAYYGDEIKETSGRTDAHSPLVVTIYKWDNKSAVRGTSTYTLPDNAADYSYSDSLSGLPVNSLQAEKTFTPSDSKYRTYYTITFKSTNGVWKSGRDSGPIVTSARVQNASELYISNTQLGIVPEGSSAVQKLYFFVPTEASDEYSYPFDSISSDYTTMPQKDITITGSATQVVRKYNAGFFKSTNVYGYDGAWDYDSVTVPYGKVTVVEWKNGKIKYGFREIPGETRLYATYTFPANIEGYQNDYTINSPSTIINGINRFSVENNYVRLTWTATITLGSNVKKYKYKINLNSWVEANKTTVLSNLDYADEVRVVGLETQSDEAYTYGPITGDGTLTYSNQSTTVDCVATRKTWTVNLNYDSDTIKSASYKINSGNWVKLTTTSTAYTFDYYDKVTFSATATTNEAPYNYSSILGTDTQTYSSHANTTICRTKTLKTFTLTPNIEGTSYGSWTVTRTPNTSYSGYKATETWDSPTTAKTIYYGDVVTVTATAAGDRYGDYNYSDSDFKVATGVWNGGDTTSSQITLTAQNKAPAYLYRLYNGSWLNLVEGTWSNKSNYTNTYVDSVGYDTTYTYHVAGYKSRSYWTRSCNRSWNNYKLVDGVTADATMSITFSESGPYTQNTWTGDNPNTKDITTGSRNQYTITWAWENSYGTIKTATEKYYWGETPSRTLPGTVSSGNYRHVPIGWDDLGAVTADRTINCVYQQQYYITVTTNTGCSNTQNGSGWYNSSSSQVTSKWTISDAKYYTFNSTTHTYTSTASKSWTPNQPQTVYCPTVYTRTYAITIRAIYNGSIVTSTTDYLPYDTETGSASYYGSTYDPCSGNYYWTQASYEQLRVTGAATISTTYAVRAQAYIGLNYVVDGSVRSRKAVARGTSGNFSETMRWYNYNNYWKVFNASYSYGPGSSYSFNTNVANTTDLSITVSPNYSYYSPLSNLARYSYTSTSLNMRVYCKVSNVNVAMFKSTSDIRAVYNSSSYTYQYFNFTGLRSNYTYTFFAAIYPNGYTSSSMSYNNSEDWSTTSLKGYGSTSGKTGS